MILTHPAHQSLIATIFPSSGMYLMSLTNLHSAPPPLTFPSTPTLQAYSTRFNKGTKYLANNAFSMATKPDLAMYYHRAAFSSVLTTFITASTMEISPHGRDLQQRSYQRIYQKALQQKKSMTRLLEKTSGQPDLMIHPKQQSLEPKPSTLLWPNPMIY